MGPLTRPSDTPVLDLLHAHRVSHKLLRNNMLNLFAIRTRFAPSVRKSALPTRGEGTSICHRALVARSVLSETLKQVQGDGCSYRNWTPHPSFGHPLPQRGEGKSAFHLSICQLSFPSLFWRLTAPHIKRQLDTNDVDKKVYHQCLYYFSSPRGIKFYNQ